MPRYDYHCGRCGKVMEIEKRISDPDPAYHPGDCGGNLTQVIHPPAVRFVGGGFYVNDYGKGR